MDASSSVAKVAHSHPVDAETILPTSHSSVTEHVQHFLDVYMQAQITRARAVSPRYQDLWRSLSRVILGGGKRMRPYLMVVAYEMYANRAASEEILKASCGIEMLHQATLIHDDVFDRDYVRHGLPNISAEFRDEYTKTHAISEQDILHLAHSTAILAGDVAIGSSYDLIRKSGVSAEQVLMLETMIDEALFDVVGGELLDNETVGTDMQSTDTETIVRHKTASLSFVSPLMSGATLAGASSDQLDLLKTFGNELGAAFQYADDLLGIFGRQEITGKSTKSDIEEGKHTLLAQQAFLRAKGDDAARLRELFGKKDISDMEADSIRRIFMKTGALEYCEQRLNDHAQKAADVVHELAISEPYKETLLAIVAKATRRDH